MKINGKKELKGNEDIQEGVHNDMGIKKKGQENILDVHVDQEKLKRSQKDTEMSKEVRQDLRIKGNKKQRSRKEIKEESIRGKDTIYCGKSMGNPQSLPRTRCLCTARTRLILMLIRWSSSRFRFLLLFLPIGSGRRTPLNHTGSIIRRFTLY